MNARCDICAADLARVLPDALEGRDRVALDPTGRDAGVLLILFDVDAAGHVVLTKRSQFVAHHKGEISLPGGKFEPGDVDLLGAALREAEEEIAVPRASLQVLGPLDDVHTIASGFTVSPWVAHHPGGRPDMTPEQSEIARILEVPLADVLAADRRIPEPPGIETLRYALQGEDVWGLTARILRTFSAVVHQVSGQRAAP
ncbi:MAG: CoA pyrophosphatase [Actinobacteria bacterium]|nr:CoA pyrophosphatase [Actinomycetota bacterium]MBM3697670.1 CoA pyrophosphatase [Actinomycetota bacterium]